MVRDAVPDALRVLDTQDLHFLRNGESMLSYLFLRGKCTSLGLHPTGMLLQSRRVSGLLAEC